VPPTRRLRIEDPLTGEAPAARPVPPRQVIRPQQAPPAPTRPAAPGRPPAPRPRRRWPPVRRLAVHPAAAGYSRRRHRDPVIPASRRAVPPAGPRLAVPGAAKIVRSRSSSRKRCRPSPSSSRWPKA
jgi:hypothetical protein